MSEPVPDYSAMPPHEMLKALGTNMHKWATAFRQVCAKQGIYFEQDWMETWFANVMVNTEQEERRRCAELPEAMLRHKAKFPEDDTVHAQTARDILRAIRNG